MASLRPLYRRYILKSESAVQKTWISSALIMAAMIPMTLVSLSYADQLRSVSRHSKRSYEATYTKPLAAKTPLPV